jgi:hypothetical protein
MSLFPKSKNHKLALPIRVQLTRTKNAGLINKTLILIFAIARGKFGIDPNIGPYNSA